MEKVRLSERLSLFSIFDRLKQFDRLEQLFQPAKALPSFEVAGETFPYLEMHTSDVPSPTLLIGLHGFGSDETQLQTLVNLELAFPFVYLAPRAWYTLTDGGYAWFPLIQKADSFTLDEAQHLESLDLLEHFIQAAKHHYGASKVYLVGYSQGASLSLSYFLHKPETLAGAVALSGTLLPEMKPEGLELATKPLFVGQGTLDTLISEQERLETKRYLEAQGVKLHYREDAIPHVVSKAQKRAVETWLTQLDGA